MHNVPNRTLPEMTSPIEEKRKQTIFMRILIPKLQLVFLNFFYFK